jgi:hypothetical protein
MILKKIIPKWHALRSLWLLSFYWCAWSLSAFPVATAVTQGPGNKTQLSNLSDGGFERQMDLPLTQALLPNSTLMHQAIQSYETLPFNIGERIKFVITYLGVQGGQAEVLLRTPVQWRGERWAHRITGEVMSADWYKWIAKIHDSVEGLMLTSPEFEPLRFYINQKEGDFSQTKIVNFENSKVKQITQRKDRDAKNEDFELPSKTKDAMGALYYVRARLAAEPSLKFFEFPVFTSEKTWILKATWVHAEEKKVGNKTFQTDVWQLTSHFGGLMEQNGDVRLWLTQDSRRLPVYVEASIKFGALKLHLKDWDPGFQVHSSKPNYEKLRLEP